MRWMLESATRLFASALLVAAAGCDGETGGTGGSPPTTSSNSTGGAGGTGGGTSSVGGMGGSGGMGNAVEPQGTSLFLQVFDTTGKPVPTAAVTVNGTTRATNGAGQILYEGVSPGRFVARVEAYGYAPVSAVADLPVGAHGGLEIRLLALGTPIPFDADAGAVLDKGATRVTIPPFAIVDENGEPVTGMVEATIVPLDPTKDMLSMPGPLEGLQSGGGTTAVDLESIFMAEISLWQNGNRLQIAPGSTATLEMVIPDGLAGQVQNGESIEAWWFDLDQGIWKEEGAGTVKPSSIQPGKLAWVADVPHLSWWNADKPWYDKNCFNVTVVDASNTPQPNMWVTAQGLSYSGGSSMRYTNALGDACIDIKLGGSANLTIGNWWTSSVVTQTVMGSGPASACSGQGAACTPITITLTGPQICTPGASQPCTYSGPANALGIGLCQAGTDFCAADGLSWLGCMGEVLPTSEDCNSSFDDDCDGLVNEEGQGCTCVPGAMDACYTGPANTINVGACKGGLRKCNLNGKSYGPCTGQVVPQTESCATSGDEDCDGQADEGCVCVPGFTQACYTGPAGTQNVGICKGGLETCAADGLSWGPCAGEVLPTTETCATPDDDDCNGSTACNGSHLFSKRFGDTGTQYGQGVAVDAAGNVIVVGYFDGTVDFGGGPLVSAGLSDIFVAKFDPLGNHLWSKRFGDAGSQEAAAVALDSTGSPVITGYVAGTVDFGGGALTSAGGEDIFALKLDANGNHLWSRRYGGSLADRGRGVAVDGATGEVFVTGFFSGMAGFGASQLVSAGLEDAFVLALDATGNVIVPRAFGGSAYQDAWGIARSGNMLVVTGVFEGTLDTSGAGVLTSAGSQDVFVISLNPMTLQGLFAQRFGDADYQTVDALAVDATDNVVLSGSFYGGIDFGGGVLTSAGNDDIFVAKLDSGLNHVWSKRFGDLDSQAAYGVAVDSAGNVLVGGAFAGAVDFGGGVLTSAGNGDIFMAKFNAAGTFLWANRYGDAGPQAVDAVAADGNGNVALTGAAWGAVDFGGGTLPGTGDPDIILAKLSP